MNVIVTDTGFDADDWTGTVVPLSDLTDGAEAVDLLSDADPSALADRLSSLRFIRVDFPSFADGRGFTIARQLRLMGYDGRLRARGRRQPPVRREWPRPASSLGTADNRRAITTTSVHWWCAARAVALSLLFAARRHQGAASAYGRDGSRGGALLSQAKTAVSARACVRACAGVCVCCVCAAVCSFGRY